MSCDVEILAIDSPESLLPIARDIITLYCAEHDVDEKNVHPCTWSDILDEIYIRVVQPNKKFLLKKEKSLYGEYDKEKVSYVYTRVYKKLCREYRQEICQSGFLDFTGIDKQTLYNWARADYARFDLQQKIAEDDENSLYELMRGDRGNPIKYLSKLNSKFQWGADMKDTVPQVSVSSVLPRLSMSGRNALELVDNSENINELNDFSD